MADALGRAATLRLLERHGIRPRKALGQHFLVDPNTTSKIVEIAGVGDGDRVIEIGAGIGTLTRALASTGATVTAFEVDERLRPVLTETLAGVAGVDLRFEDAMTVEATAFERCGTVMVANLPYNVGTPLVLRALREALAIRRFVVMLQRESVERMVARPGTKTYGLPSVVVGLHARVAIAMRVKPSVFVPQPQVDSAVAVLDRVAAPLGAERALALAAAGFGQRRKMLRSSLRGLVGEEVFAAAGVDATARAEDLEPGVWLNLAEGIDAG